MAEQDNIDQLKQRIHLLEEALGQSNRIRKQWHHANQSLAASRQALKKSEMQYRTLFESSTDAILIMDETAFFDCNKSALDMFGWASFADISGHLSGCSPSFQPCGTDSRILADAYIATAFKNSSHEFEWMHKRMDGSEFPAEVWLSAMKLDGKPVLQATVRDITKRKQSEDALRILSSAVEQAGESIIITDRGSIIEYVNPAFVKTTGYSINEAIGETPQILKSGNQDAAFYASMWKIITSGHIWHGKVIDRRKDGSFFPALLTISPIMNEYGEITHFVALHADLTEQENLERQFYQSQKMETIGTMVGGIAHNFNNMLAGMIGNLYLAKKKVQAQPDVVRNLANVEELSRNAAEMIQQLLTFARKGVVRMNAMSLTSFIKEILKLLHASVPENIAVHQDICSEDLQIKGDDTQLHQVLANLINNARDAVEGVGEPRITIRLKAFYPDAVFLEHHADFKVCPYAHLSVKDNGCGIPSTQMEQLFEPFFTTKKEGRGTGLGLSMVHGVVKTHHGFVDVISREGKGSTFHVYIPLLKSKEKAAKPVQSLEAAEGQDELILLADDEQVVREVMAEILESLGYRVIQASDGLEAMELFNTYQQEVALVLLDVVMSHCGGMPLAKRMRMINPDVPVIFLTGYDKDHVLHGDDALPNSEMLTKPVEFDVLSCHIRYMLDYS